MGAYIGPRQWLKTQNGELVPVVTFQVHLDSLVTNDQQSGKELGRRLSTAGATMKKLQDFWKQATTAWKLRVFSAYKTSQGLYVWLRYLATGDWTQPKPNGCAKFCTYPLPTAAEPLMRQYKRGPSKSGGHHNWYTVLSLDGGSSAR